MSESYKIKLGIDLDTSDLQTQINRAGDNINPIDIKVDAETKELTKSIKDALDAFSKNGQNALTLDTSKFEDSIKDIKDAVVDLKRTLSSLDDSVNIKSLLSSVNQIANAIGKVTDESDTLAKSLNALSKKEFGFNLSVDMGKNNVNTLAYGRAARKQVIPQLESQIKELEGLFGGQQAAMSKLMKRGTEVNFDIFSDFKDFNSDSAIKKMEAMEKYINSLKKLASIENIKLDGFNDIHKDATTLINDVTGVENAVEKAEDTVQKLKNIFSNGVDATALSAQLDPIVTNLNEIRTAIENLSKGVSLDGLTASFDRLSGAIENLLKNAEKVKGVFNSDFSNNKIGTKTTNSTSTKDVISDSSQAISSAKQVGNQIGNALENGVEQSVDLNDVIDDEVIKIMDKFAIVGEKGSAAFNEIRKAIVECRADLESLNKKNLDDFGNNKDLLIGHARRQAVDKVTNAIANQMEAEKDYGDEYIALADYMTSFNDPKKGYKVRIPTNIKQDQGDDYRSNKGTLGIAFNVERGNDFADFVKNLNRDLGQTIDLTKGEAEAFDELVRKVQLGRKQRENASKGKRYLYESLTTEEILEQNGIGRNEIYDDTMIAVDAINAQEKVLRELAQSSTQTANTVVQDENRKQQAAQQTADAYDKISKDVSLTRDAESGIDFKDNFNSYNGAAQEAKMHFKSLLEDEKAAVSVVEQFDDSNMLKSFIVNIQRASGEVENLHYALEKLDDGDYGDFKYQGASSNDKNVQKQYDARIKKANDLQVKLDKAKSEYTDMGHTKPIKNSDYIAELDKQYEKVEKAILDVKNADSSTFASMVSNAEREKAALESMIKIYRNADNVSNSLKGTDFASGVKIRIEELGKFKAQASDFPQMTKTIEQLDNAIAGVGDKSSLDSFTDQLKVARAELAKVKAETIATNRKEKVGIDVSSATSRIANMQRISPEIDDFETKIDGADVSVKTLLNDLSKVNTAGDFSVVNKRIKAFEEAAQAAGIAVKETASKLKTVDDIKDNIKLGKYDNQISKMHSDLSKLSYTANDVRKSVSEVEDAYHQMVAAAQNVGDEVADKERLVQLEKEYAQALEKTNNLIKIQTRKESRQNKDNRESEAAEKLADKKTALELDMANYLKDNSRAARDFGDEIQRLMALLGQLDNMSDIDGVERKFKNLKREIKAAGKEGLTAFDKLKLKAKEYLTYFSVAEALMYIEQAARSMFEQVKLIDSAMTELKKVTDETDATYDKFLTNAASRVKEIGTTIDGLVSSTADFARLGYGFEDAQGLAEVANIYAVVGDEIEGVEGATENLISTMAAFKDEMNGMSDSDFALSVVDKLNEVANNYSISSGGLGEALKRSASSMATASNTLDETIALTTAANEVVQNPEKVGNAMKTISMRIRGAKTELEEAGESTDGMVESTATLRAEIEALSGVDIMASPTEFKSTFDILDELSQKWEDLSDISRATIIELMAGKHQGNVFASLMENFDTARDALETSLNSSGSALKEHSKWQQSLESRILSLKASWQGLSQAFLSSDFLRATLNGVIELVDGLTKLIDTVGAFPTVTGVIAGTVSILKNEGIFTVLNKGVIGAQQQLAFFGKSFSDISDDLKSKQGLFRSIFSKSITKSDISNIQAYNNLIDQCVGSQTAYYRTMQNSSAAAKNLVAGANGGKVAMSGLKTATIGGKLALFGLEAAATAANIALTMGLSLAIQLVVEGIMKLVNADKELAESVEEVTSKYKQQHDELKKLKGDYNTSNEDSLISKYGRLSKGVDEFGENISLTADEYSEYKSIVNTIANQMPSLVTGYNSQGTAILECAGNVSALTEEYKNLIKAQDESILNSGNDIFKDFENDLKGTTLKDNITNQKDEITDSFNDDHLKQLNAMLGLKGRKLDDYLSNLSASEALRISRLLNESGLKRDAVFSDALGDGAFNSETTIEHIKRVLKNNASEVKKALGETYDDINAFAEDASTITSAYLSTAFLGGNEDYGIADYSNIKERFQSMISNITSGFGSDFYAKFLGEEDSKQALMDYLDSMLNAFKSLDEYESKELEATFDLKTNFNKGEISYGEYVNSIREAADLIDGLDVGQEVKDGIKLSLNTDEVIKNYDVLKERLTSDEYNIQMKSDEAEEFLNNLTASEYQVAVDLMMSGEVDLSDFDIKSLREYIEKQAKLQEAMNYTIAIDVEAESLGALNTAMAESVSGAGLSSEAIAALKGRYAELESEGYNLSAMFEETANGIHLNRKAVGELEQKLASNKLVETDKQLSVLKNRYDELTTEIDKCRDAGDRAALYTEQQSIVEKINDLATLASQYEGLTSAYNAWQNAESAGQERDMYESVIEGFENIGDEISRGWVDDGTIKFLELLTGKTDLAGKSGKQLKEIYDGLDDSIKYLNKDGKVLEDTGYSVRDFFTVDEDGNSTNAGVYNFLDAIGKLEEEAFGGKDVVKRDDKGNIIGFDFELVAKEDKNGNVIKNGDQVIAEALGISEELVQIMVRASDDAGFVVNLEGAYTQLADLKTEAESARDTLISLQNKGLKELKGVDVNFDLDAEGGDLVKEQEKSVKLLDKFKKNGKIDLTMEGAQQALDIAEYLTIKLDDLTEPRYMQIDATQVEEDIREPLEDMQEFEKLSKKKHLLQLTGDKKKIKEVQDDMDEIANGLEDLDKETKVKLGIDGLTSEEIADKLEKGEIEIPAELNLDVQMSDDLKDMRLMMMNQLGLASDNEVKLKVGYDIDESAVDKLTPDEQKVVVEYIAKNEDEFNKYTEEEKEIVVNLVANGVDLEKYDVEDKEAIVNYIANGEEADGWTPEAKDAFVEYLADGGEIDKFDPENKDSWVVYDTDTTKPDGYEPDDEDATVTYDKDSSVPDGYDPNDPKATVTYNKDTSDIDSYNPPNFIRTVIYKIKTAFSNAASKGAKVLKDRFGIGEVNGTANVNGTTGRAYSQGSWGTKSSGTALVGELGVETLVRGGRYYTIGDNGAEFIKYQRGDIIFNHKQTEELFANGKVTSGGGRGKALASGTAFSRGTGGIGKVSGVGKTVKKSKVTEVDIDGNEGKTYTIENVTTVKQKKANNGSSGYNDDTNGRVDDKAVGTTTDKDKFEETFDFIETAISRIERKIDNLDKKANSVYRSWTDRNNNLVKEIEKVQDEISLQQSAYSRYMQEANSIGLSSSWAEKVRNGAIDISTIKDEKLAEKIKKYEEFYEKALACKDAIEELKETEKDLIKQKFDNVIARYDGLLSIIEHEKSMLDEYISQSEAQGWLVSAKYYDALASNERENIAKLEAKKAELLAKLQEAENSGIAKNSEAWVEMVNDIDDVTLAIEQANTALLEYAQTIQQLKWEQFDLLQDRISAITEEADFLIELMSSDKLFDDKGKFTDKGMATAGLHGQNYNVYMHQADMVADEIERLKAELAKDPYDTELEERYREMIALQQEYILNAQKEKEAIRDLVSEGIEIELDALSELIDKYNESLESQKDLYEYNKRVEEQTKNIASLQKQLSSIEGDDSEEAKAKIQELKVSLEEAESELEETEYDKYIADQAALLDGLYLEYETVLNERLDNLDALIASMIDQINANAGTISTTINESATSVGYTLSDAMKTTWDTSTSAITGGQDSIKKVIELYGNNFEDAQTKTNDALKDIKSNTADMIRKLDSIAKDNAKDAGGSSAGNQNKPHTGGNTGGDNGNNKGGTGGGDGKPEVGDKVTFVSGKYYYDPQGKSPLGSKNLGKQVYITNINKHSWATHPIHISTGKKLGDGDLGWLKKEQISGYATGKQNFSGDEIAWTQEGRKQEFVVRPSDGAILTPIARGDSVLNAVASRNIWDMANSPADFIRDNLNLGVANVPNNSSSNNTITQNFDKIVFSMPNVKNYDDMIRTMQRDPNFERLVSSMTIGKITGQSSLAKGKAIR